MPEGDTIYRSARAMQRALAGRVVTGFDAAYARLVSVDDETPLKGRTVEKVEANGKWLMIYFSGDLILLTHMLMNGSWHLYRTGEKWRRRGQDMRVVIRTAEWEAVGFLVPVAEFHTARTLAKKTMIPKLGPDLLKAEFAEDEALRRIREKPDEEIAVVIMNQQVMAGIGNVYKSEVCFACGVNPFRLVRTLSSKELECLIEKARSYLAANVMESSGEHPVTYSGLRRTTRAIDSEARLWVYGRQGRECRRCGTKILSRKQGVQSRSTYWCPQCQEIEGGVEGWSALRMGKTGCS